MNELGMLLFITGCVLGSIAGVMVVSLCVISRRSDEHMAQRLKEEEK